MGFLWLARKRAARKSLFDDRIRRQHSLLRLGGTPQAEEIEAVEYRAAANAGTGRMVTQHHGNFECAWPLTAAGN